MNTLKLDLIMKIAAAKLSNGKVQCRKCRRVYLNKHGFLTHFTMMHGPDNGRYFARRSKGKIFCYLTSTQLAI